MYSLNYIPFPFHLLFELQTFSNNNYFDNIKNIDNTEINKLNEITIQYDVKNNDKIKLFGKKFIENNKNNCKIIVENKEQDISECIIVNKKIEYDN